MQTTRRNFIKVTALTGATITLGEFLPSCKFKPSNLLEGEGSLPTSDGTIIAISDVDAHSQCSMRIELTEGKAIKISGNPKDPESKGELTSRDKHMLEILYTPDRLTHPLKRKGKRGSGQWERISWDEALTTVANRLSKIKQEDGAEAIHFIHGHYHSGDILGSFLPRLANLIGTPNVSNPSYVCHMPRVFFQYNFDLGAVVPPDIPNTKCIILWGGNPRATNKPQEIALREARERGVKLIVIDPRRIEYAEDADIHAQLRPGTDGALALGMLNVIITEDLYDRKFVQKWTYGFEQLKKHVESYTPEKVEDITWVPAETIRKMARMYATNKPSCISPRNALDQHTNASCAIRAINILMAITGNIDVKGGNLIIVPISLGLEDLKLYEKLPLEMAAKKLGADTSLYSKLSQYWPSAHTPAVWDAILEGKPYFVKGMFVMAANPVLTCANTNIVQRALMKLDFLVVADWFMTPTAEVADIVLPACTFLERTRFTTYDTHADHGWNQTSRLVLSPKVVEPVGESWSDWKILCELGRKMGYAEYFPWKTEEEAIDYQLSPLGVTVDELRAHPEGIIIDIPPILYKKFSGFFGGILRKILGMTKLRDYPDMYKKYETLLDGFMTPSKKIEIYSERLKEYGHDPLPVYHEPAESPVSQPVLAKKFPLILIAGTKLEMYTHSMMRNIPGLRKECPHNLLEINPRTAKKLGIRNGMTVRVESPRGRITCPAKVTDRIDPRVVHLYFGFAESNCNILTDHRAFDPITGSTGLKSLLCRVEQL